MENDEEAAGQVASGASTTSNMFAGPAGEIGLGANWTEADYREFTICFPTIRDQT